MLKKDIIDKMAAERTKNSLKIVGMMGNRAKNIGKPNKFTMTRYGPKIDFNLFCLS